MILAIGSAADATFMYGVASLIARGHRVDLIDLVSLVEVGQVEVSLAFPDQAQFTIPGLTMVLGEYSGVLCRLIDLASAAPDSDRGTYALGVLRLLREVCGRMTIPVINGPGTDQSNFSKILHLASVGACSDAWRIPDTIVSSDADALFEFARQYGGEPILKGVSSRKTWVKQLYGEIHADGDERFAPVLLQEPIHGSNVRVHVVGTDLFAEEIVSADVDYRISRSNQTRQIELPTRIADGCLRVAQRLGVMLAGIDFMIDESGAWYFLEGNSLPAYEGYDRRSGGAISNAIARVLTSQASR